MTAKHSALQLTKHNEMPLVGVNLQGVCQNWVLQAVIEAWWH